MRTSSRQPIFPLGNTLVPGGELALQLFEPRYLQLLADLQVRPAAERLFGVVLIARGHEVGDRTNEIHLVGTAGRLDLVRELAPMPQPAFGVSVVGTRRFRIRQLLPPADPAGASDAAAHPGRAGAAAAPDRAGVADRARSTPARDAAHDRRYAMAEVDWLQDAPADPVLLGVEAAALRQEHAAFLNRLGVRPVDLGEDPEMIAWLASEHTPLLPGAVQVLLELDDPIARTRAMRAQLKQESALGAHFTSIPHRALPDGSSRN